MRGLILLIMIAVLVTTPAIPAIPTVKEASPGVNYYAFEDTGLKKFSSYIKLVNYLWDSNNNQGDYYWGYSLSAMSAGGFAPGTVRFVSATESDFGFTINDDADSPGEGGTPVDFSTTNIQVEGVDEPDIVKTDGEYIYVVSGSRVIIIDAYPPEDARILSEIEAAQVIELYINGDKLVLLGDSYVKVYDISDRENPDLKRDVNFNGNYFKSRMIGGYVYIIINKYVSPYYCYTCSPVCDYQYRTQVELPSITVNGETYKVPATEIYYLENFWDYSYNFTTIMTINTQNDLENITSGTVLMSTAQNLYVSSNNIYITYTVRDSGYGEKTVIHKISITKGAFEYKGKGEVPGAILNQFFMDEHQGYFRIATTTSDPRHYSTTNNLYILDANLNIVGRLENLAPGEGTYSVRFMGNRAYLVTFLKVDPLFVIDLTDPTNPTVLGELKIPGYSDYLHPYDETHIIGIGKDACDTGDDYAWYQGVKIALFDVSDPENPIEISNYIIGDRGTDSLALSDHRAFLFDRERNLLVIPISLAEIDGDSTSPRMFGQPTWQGAYVFDISLDGGLAFRGRITHSENSIRSWNCYSYPDSVKRSLYIDNVLYTISDGMVKMNDLVDLSEMGAVILSGELISSE